MNARLYLEYLITSEYSILYKKGLPIIIMTALFFQINIDYLQYKIALYFLIMNQMNEMK